MVRQIYTDEMQNLKHCAADLVSSTRAHAQSVTSEGRDTPTPFKTQRRCYNVTSARSEHLQNYDHRRLWITSCTTGTSEKILNYAVEFL